MGIVLHSNPVSSNALKVRFLLAELGLEYERRDVPIGRPRPDWYIGIYPFATIPFMLDGELELGESNAMLRYLANREGRSDLYPADAPRRSRVDWALDAFSTQIRGGLFPAEQIGLMHGDWERGRARAEDADQAELARAIVAAGPRFDLMERFVADNGTVTGEFSIADCCFAPVLWRWGRLPVDLGRWPRVKLLRETVTARPGFAAAEPVA